MVKKYVHFKTYGNDSEVILISLKNLEPKKEF